MGMALLAALGRWPFTQIEHLLYDKKLDRMPELPAPVFIIGHWRSGTTHLCNVLSKSPRFGFLSPIASGLPWEILTMGRLFRRRLEKQLPSSRLIDNVPVNPDSPQEDEFAIANMSKVSFLHALYFPSRFEEHIRRGVFLEGLTEKEVRQWRNTFLYLLKKISYEQGADKHLLVKNPVYTARVKMIKELVPRAKFIHIYRNPHRIFPSMKNYYRKLLPAMALQSYEKVDIERVILRTYRDMMDRLEREAKQINTEDFAHVKFEDFEREPLNELERVFDQLQLADFETDRPYLQNYLDSITNYRKNTFETPKEDQTLVREFWGGYLEKLGY